jgi:Tol biopolymer transport system component/tRNA A-37 threonylcarbamoyl transferase component Bud32
MGEVYKARDTRLARIVAIKVLPAQTADRPEARQRFEREAQAVSALHHPHICTLYDVGQDGGLDFLVMEYLDGDTLASRLKRGALPLDQTLRIATEVADAVDRAHRTGIVHRDLKPGNIMLTKDGSKVLDFGLAKMRPQSTGAAMSGGSVMQTLTSPLTGEGALVGTLQYMAPEQLEGQDADARSDVFSFGAVLYEMATGRRPFEGRTQATLIAQIMQTDPPGISVVMPQAPPALEQLARTCLAKDPDERRQTMRDVLTDLKWIASAGSRPPAARVEAPHQGRFKARKWQALAGAMALVAAWAAGDRWLRKAPESPTVRFTVAAPEKSMLGSGLALSPDGKRLVFVATMDGQDELWMRAMDSLSAQPLTGTEGAQFPFWSPDGRSVAFFAQGKLKRIDVIAGTLEVICDAVDPRGGSWGPDGVILVAPESGLPLMRVAATGGTPVAITRIDTSRLDVSHRWPYFLPDGRHYLCFIYSSKPANDAIGVGSLDSPILRVLAPADSAPAYSPPGLLLFARGTNLLAQPFNAAKLQLSGDPALVVQNVSVVGISTGASAAIQASVSSTGTLVYQTGGDASEQLAWFDRTRKLIAKLGSPGRVGSPELSPDGKRVVADGAEDLSLIDSVRGIQSRFTFSGQGDNYALWSPDGTQILFCSFRTGRNELYTKATGGVATEQLLPEGELDKIPDDWSRVGHAIVFEALDPKTKVDLYWAPDEGDRKPVPYLRTPYNESHGRISPDGKRLAYTSDEAGRSEVYVQTFPVAGGGKYQISANGGDQPRWRNDGRELYYMSLDRKLMSADVKEGASFEAGTPKLLFQTQAPVTNITTFRNHYTVTPDGQKFLIVTIASAQTAAPLVVVQNWAQKYRY